MSDKEYWQAMARIQMLNSAHPKARIGAVIVYKNQVIGQGYNKQKTHPMAKNFSRHIHAELDAVLNVPRKLRINLEGASIYLYREDKEGRSALCKPCKFCCELLKQVGIKTIYYTENE